MKLRVLLLAILFAALSPFAVSQTTPFGYTNNVFAPTGTLNNSPVRIVSFGTIRVCTEPASGTPCTPLATIYKDAALTQVQSNPFQTDKEGNYTFFVPAGTYHIQQSGPQVATTDIPYIQFGVGGGGGGNCPGGTLFDVQINNPLGTCGADPGIFQEFPSTHTMTDTILQAFQQVNVSDATHSGQVCQGHSNGTIVDSAYCTQPSPTFSTTAGGYVLFPPDNAPAAVGDVVTVTSITPTNVQTQYGTLPGYPTQFISHADVGNCGGLGSTPGDICYYNGSAWVVLPGNGGSQKILTETSGVPSWQLHGNGTSLENLPYIFTDIPCNSPASCSDLAPIPVPGPANVFLAWPRTDTGGVGYLTNTATAGDNSGSLSTATVTFPFPTQAGDPLVLVNASTTVINPTDTCGNTWVPTANGHAWYVASAVPCTSLNTVTQSLSGPGNFAIGVGEVLGGGELDVQVSGGSCGSVSGSTYPITFNSLTTTNIDTLVTLISQGTAAQTGLGIYVATGGLFMENQTKIDGGGGLGLSYSVAMGWEPALTIGSNHTTMNYTYTGSSNICSAANSVTLAFKPSSTNNPANPSARQIYMDDLEKNILETPSDGDGLVFDATFGIYKNLIFGSGLNYDPITHTLTSSGAIGTVTTTGTPASPELTCFSGATTITNCNLSDNVSTSNTAAVKVLKVNDVSYPSSPSTNTVPVITSTNTVTYEALPNAANGTPGTFQAGFTTIATAQTAFSVVSNAMTFPANFGSVAGIASAVKCSTNPSGTVTFTLVDQTTSTTIGTVQVSSSCGGTFATTGGTTQAVSANDFLTMTSGTDATAANIAFNLRATRN